MEIINDLILSDNRNKHLDELIENIDKTYGMKNVGSIIMQLPFKFYELYKDKVKWCNFNGMDLSYKFGSIPDYSNLNVITNNEFEDTKVFVILKNLDDPVPIRC